MGAVRVDYPLADLHCQGTLALSVALILTVLSSYYHQDSHFCKVHTFLQKYFCPYRMPTYHLLFKYSTVSVANLVPSIFKAHHLDE